MLVWVLIPLGLHVCLESIQNFVWRYICLSFPGVKAESLLSAFQKNMESETGFLKTHWIRGSRSLQAQYKPLSSGETLFDFTLINRRLCFFLFWKGLEKACTSAFTEGSSIQSRQPAMTYGQRGEASASVTPATTGSEPLYRHLWEHPPHIMAGSTGGSRAQWERNKASFMIEDDLLSISQNKAI